MDYYFYKHSLKYNKILNELNNLFTNINNQISDPEFITSSYCDHILNQNSQESYPKFVTAGYFNNTEESSQESYPEFVSNYNNNIEENVNIEPLQIPPLFVTEYYDEDNIDDILYLDPNHNYNYDESEKLYGDFDDWEDYIDSIYN